MKRITASVLSFVVFAAAMGIACSDSNETLFANGDAGVPATPSDDAGEQGQSEDGSTPPKKDAATDAGVQPKDGGVVNTQDAGPRDSGSRDGATTDSSVTTACKDIERGTATIERVNATPPTLNGGTLVDGTYLNTKRVLYTTATGATSMDTWSEGIEIQSGTIRISVVLPFAAVSRAYSYTASGSTISMTRTCPVGSAVGQTWQYKIDGDKIVIRKNVEGSGQTFDYTFQKKP